MELLRGSCFVRSKMPLIKPVLMVSIIMATTGALKGFDIPYIMTNGGLAA
ncbi:hypothetical protein ACFSQ7_14395 [Paenibacillus rhizoplanae]